MKLKAFATTLVVTLLAALPSAAQDTGASPTVYNVEILVFRATQSLGGAENWNVQGDRNDDGTSDEETGNAARTMGRFVGSLNASQFQLTPLENKLRSTGLYVPVAHAAWSQTASDWGTRAGFAVQKLGLDAPGLTGTVFLERGQYLHLGMALSYSPASPAAGIGAAPGSTFNLSESRRIRFYERNYYDHPAFGVIALVTPAQGARPAGR
jgi:Peptidoglycan-binding protein, CsiV